ncbi:hypothetical protein ACSQ67_020949 [Phaseolus vulgaris]
MVTLLRTRRIVFHGFSLSHHSSKKSKLFSALPLQLQPIEWEPSPNPSSRPSFSTTTPMEASPISSKTSSLHPSCFPPHAIISQPLLSPGLAPGPLQHRDHVPGAPGKPFRRGSMLRRTNSQQ